MLFSDESQTVFSFFFLSKIEWKFCYTYLFYFLKKKHKHYTKYVM